MPADSEILNASQAASFLGTHVETVRRLARRGAIPSFKVGTDWRFSMDALRRWFEQQDPRGRAASVLVIDDDPEVVRSIARTAERLGYRAHRASNGAEGLELVSRETPGLIFLDLVMPGQNGPEFLDELRPAHPDLPVVIVTGYPDSDLMHRAAKHPPIMLLSKPATPDQIERTIRTVLGDPPAAQKAGRRGAV